ncbi:MAG: class I SAM-dependent methyltransferase [Gemmatimonadetes bacterium]|jgi:SAM-dependent methyltransferase|nr:class I SAM-dependent methyltransferase [Gemmatimonadota bacterium]
MTEQTIEPTPWGQTEIRGPVHLFRERLLMRLFQPRLDEGRVLDAGCGSGSLALELAKCGFRVDALERSTQFVEMVRHKITRYGNESRISVHQGSVTALPFDDAVFDGAVCGEVLEHVRPEDGGDRGAIAELARVLRPGAPVVASVPLNQKLWDEADEWAGHVKRYGREEFADLFREAGFEIESVRVWGFPLGRIYHRLLFGPWIRRTSALTQQERDERSDTRAARNPALVETVAGVFRFDELFSRWPLGRGVMIAARRK